MELSTTPRVVLDQVTAAGAANKLQAHAIQQRIHGLLRPHRFNADGGSAQSDLELDPQTAQDLKRLEEKIVSLRMEASEQDPIDPPQNRAASDYSSCEKALSGFVLSLFTAFLLVNLSQDAQGFINCFDDSDNSHGNKSQANTTTGGVNGTDPGVCAGTAALSTFGFWGTLLLTYVLIGGYVGRILDKAPIPEDTPDTSCCQRQIRKMARADRLPEGQADQRRYFVGRQFLIVFSNLFLGFLSSNRQLPEFLSVDPEFDESLQFFATLVLMTLAGQVLPQILGSRTPKLFANNYISFLLIKLSWAIGKVVVIDPVIDAFSSCSAKRSASVSPVTTSKPWIATADTGAEIPDHIARDLLVFCNTTLSPGSMVTRCLVDIIIDDCLTELSPTPPAP